MPGRVISRQKASAEIKCYLEVSKTVNSFVKKANEVGSLDSKYANFISSPKNAFVFTFEELQAITAGIASGSLSHLVVILGASDEDEPGYEIGSQTVILAGAKSIGNEDFQVAAETVFVQYPSKFAVPNVDIVEGPLTFKIK
jgi:hypothetical protein